MVRFAEGTKNGDKGLQQGGVMGFLGWFKGKILGSSGVIHNESDDDNIVAHRTSKASRDYVCETCNAEILKHQEYSRLTRRIEGHLRTGKHCLECRPLARVP